MPGQPERLDVLSADLLDDEVDDVLQVLVVGHGPDPRRGVRGCDDQAVFVYVIHQREIVTLPVSIRAGSVKAEHEGDLFSLLQVARVIKKVCAARLHLDNVPLVYHHSR